jgi:Flp pilus assembly protein TadB
MMVTLVVSWALLMGVEIRRLAVLVAALLFPLPVGVLIVWHSWQNRPGVATRSVEFCDAVSSELKSGAPLRMALGAAATSVDAHDLRARCDSGTPIGFLAASLRDEFPDVGPELAVVVERVAALGGPSADLFREISSLALAQVELAQEVASGSAAARATAFVLLMVPVVALVAVGTRGLGEYLQSPAQIGAVLIGFLMVLAGLGVGAWMMRRAR